MQPTQVKSLTLNLLMYPSQEPATRQGVFTPRIALGINSALFLPLIVKEEKGDLLNFHHTFYEPLLRKSVEEKVFNCTVTCCSMNIT